MIGNWPPEPQTRAKALIVDPHAAVREMVAMLLDREGKFHVVAEAASGIEGLRAFRQYAPNLVISEIQLPEINGAEMLHIVREERPSTRWIYFSATTNESLVRLALEAGPHGFVHKSESLNTVRQAVSAVAEGITFFGPFATREMERLRSAGKCENPLTPRQRIVLQLVAEGFSTKQVASRLSLSPKTVEHYRTQVMQRLGLRDVASLTRYAMRCGLVPED